MANSFPVARVVALAVVAGATVLLCLWLVPTPEQSTASVNMDLPSEIAGFVGEVLEATESERAVLPADTQFAKMHYTKTGSDDIFCQIVLAGSEKRSIHRPEVCLPSQGWMIAGSKVVPVQLAGGRTLEVTELRLQRPVSSEPGEKRMVAGVYYYWFVGKQTTTAHHITRVVKTNLDLLLHNVNHRWAYVIVNGIVQPSKSFEDTGDSLKDFIAQIAPIILPQETLDTLPQ